jgi:hypothetical protein
MHTVNHIEERVMAKEKIWTSRRKKYIYQRAFVDFCRDDLTWKKNNIFHTYIYVNMNHIQKFSSLHPA